MDWDGTCVGNGFGHSAYPEMGEWLPGAAHALRYLQDKGYELVIFTTRLAHTEIDEVTPLPIPVWDREYQTIRAMLDAEGLTRVDIWTKPWKPGAKYYIDDKAIPIYPSDGWEGVLELLGE